MIIGFIELAAARPTGGEGVKSGPIALATILVLCIVAYFLFKSMAKHLKKVRDEFPTDHPEPPPADGTAQRPDEANGASLPSDERSDETPPDSSA